MQNSKDQVEELEISVLTEDQIDNLPEDAVESVRVLSSDLANKQLQVFVPVVQKYIELRDLALRLKIDKNEKGEVTKESIQDYKDLKKATGSFNSELKAKIKEIKDPLNDTRSKVISVEKTFKSESDKIKQEAEKLFQEYEDEVARKKQEAIDKKNAALNAKIKEAEEAASEMQKTSARSQVINDLKYKEILEGITQKASDAVNNLNEVQIKTLSQSFSILEFKDILANYDISDIDQKTIDDLEVSFNTASTNAQLMLNDKLQSLKNERELAFSRRQAEDPTPAIVPTTRSEDVAPSIPDAPMGIPGAEPTEFRFVIYMDTPNSFFTKNIENVISKLEEAIDAKLRKGVTPELAELKDKFNQFNS